MDDNQDWSERYRVQGEVWCDVEAAAQLLEECKSATLAQWCSEQGDIPVNRAEQNVKSSPEWRLYLENMVEARRKANVAKVRLESIKMRSMEWHAKSANYRAEARIT